MKANQYTVELIISFYYKWLKGYTTNLGKLLKQGIYIVSSNLVAISGLLSRKEKKKKGRRKQGKK